MISEATSAGVGKYTIDLAEGLLNQGHEVHLLYATARIDNAFREGLARLSGLRSEVIEFKRSPHPEDVFNVSKVLKYIRQHGPMDILHGQSSKGGAISRLAGIAVRCPVVYTPLCISTLAPTFGRISRAIFGRIEWLLAMKTSMILCASQDEFDHINSLGIPFKKLRLVHYGVAPPINSSRDAVRRSLGLQQDAILVGFVGRFTAQKNPEMLVRAFAAAAQQTAEARLVLIGSGELEPSLRRIAEELGISQRIDWLGYRPGCQSMPAFDILAVPSSYESLPYVMLEGLTIGLPIVITAVAGARDGVVDGVNGFVIEPYDEAAMTQCLQKLIESAQLRESFSAAAKMSSAEFTLSRMIEKTMDVYEQCLTSSHKQATDN